MATEETPWVTRRWSPLAGGRGWNPDTMSGDYVAWIGTPTELAAGIADRADVPRRITSGFTRSAPHEYAEQCLTRVQEEDGPRRDLVAVVWDRRPYERWDGARNAEGEPDHAIAVVTGGDGTSEDVARKWALLDRLRLVRAECRLRESVVELYQANGGNINQVHAWSGAARSTLYRALRAAGIEPTAR